jgi:hypothetical protein
MSKPEMTDVMQRFKKIVGDWIEFDTADLYTRAMDNIEWIGKQKAAKHDICGVAVVIIKQLLAQLQRQREAVPKDSWVDLHAAWKSSDVDVSDSDVYTTGIHTPYHGNLIECHGNSEAEAIKLRDTVFEALSTHLAGTSKGDGE